MNIQNDYSTKEAFGNAGRMGIKSVISFVLVLVLYGIINTGFFIYSIIRYKQIEESHLYALCIGFTVILGIVFTVLALYFMYRYVFIKGITAIYGLLMPFFKNLCLKIVDKIGSKIPEDNFTKKGSINKILNVGDLIKETYDKKLPSFVQKAIGFLLKKIPFSDLALSMKDSIKGKERQEAANDLFLCVDNYIRQQVLTINLTWIWVLASLNIVMQIILAYILQVSFMQ